MSRSSMFRQSTSRLSNGRTSWHSAWLLRLTLVSGLGLAALSCRERSLVAQEQAPSKPAAADWLLFVSAFASGPKAAIQAYRFHSDQGRLETLHQTTDVQNPFFLAVAPNGKYLFSIHAPQGFGGKENEQVAAYELVGRSGQLKLLNRQSSLGTASCYLDVDQTGRSVLLANYLTGSVASYPIREDGSLGEAATFVQHEGASVNPARQKGPHAHAILCGPNNRFVYAADLGLDQVLTYQLDPGTAKLKPAPQPFVRTPPGAGPRHLTFHPNGRHLFVINELSNSVTRFDHDAETGMLIERQTISTLPKDFDGTSYCADLKITPDGRFLYGTNRGHDSVAAYRIGDDGQLTLVEIEPSLGKGPQNLLITPDGKWLLCANMPGNNVVVFQIDATTGKLAPHGQPVEIASPSCIRLVSERVN